MSLLSRYPLNLLLLLKEREWITDDSWAIRSQSTDLESNTLRSYLALSTNIRQRQSFSSGGHCSLINGLEVLLTIAIKLDCKDEPQQKYQNIENNLDYQHKSCACST